MHKTTLRLSYPIVNASSTSSQFPTNITLNPLKSGLDSSLFAIARPTQRRKTGTRFSTPHSFSRIQTSRLCFVLPFEQTSMHCPKLLKTLWWIGWKIMLITSLLYVAWHSPRNWGCGNFKASYTTASLWGRNPYIPGCSYLPHLTPTAWRRSNYCLCFAVIGPWCTIGRISHPHLYL